MASTKISKSAAVRAELPKHDGSPKRTAEALQKKGYDISAQYVSVVKNADKTRSKKKRAQNQPNSKKTPEIQAIQAMIGMAMELIHQSGGVEEAHELVDSAANLMERLQ